MIKWGVAAGTHDGSLTVMRGDKILFASHSERYSGIKNDKDLNADLVAAALEYGSPEVIFWYENPYTKALRKLYAGQPNRWLSPKKYLKKYGLDFVHVEYGNHHASHMAAGYYTSPFEHAATLVIDAIGEFNTASIWKGEKKVWTANYPASLGLFYSAMTARVGLKPNEDEYILMGMAAYGNPDRFYNDMKELCIDGTNFHRGCRWWKPELTEEDYFDVAAATQKLYEKYFAGLLRLTRDMTGKRNLVFMGGCALNCLANRIIPEYFDNHWIMPNPGDAGSSLGAILAKTKQKVKFDNAFLGEEIKGKYPVDKALEELLQCGIVGVASGRAEFGPRALGNRSLLADPRGQEMKDKVNGIKQRQEFRPFAPVILESDVQEYFNVTKGFSSPYMQQVVRCKYPTKFPAIVHEDGTSRVQTVTKKSHPGLFALLTKWKEETGCPMLLNTSLNIKGKPIVNNLQDARDFQNKYKVKVVS
jgi:carbamoyltransferase